MKLRLVTASVTIRTGPRDPDSVDLLGYLMEREQRVGSQVERPRLVEPAIAGSNPARHPRYPPICKIRNSR